jgi:Na+/proline symporter
MNEAMKVRAARTCVVLFGLLAFVMATYADSVYALVEEASAFGSAGIFVVGTLALFTDVGGPRAATAGLVSGLASYVYGSYFAGWETPYLVSLAVSATAYALAALSESDRWKAPVADSFEVPPENDPSRPAR